MQRSRAAVRYARAVMSMARDRNLVQEVNSDMGLISKTLDENEDLRIFLKSPVIRNDMKRNVLQEIFGSVNELTKNLFDVLLENNRVDILAQVAAKYRSLYNELHKVQIATVITAIPLTPELEQKMLEKVKELTGKEAELRNVVNEEIIGGFILRVGDLEYNASVKAQLTSLSRVLHNNTYIAKI